MGMLVPNNPSKHLHRSDHVPDVYVIEVPFAEEENQPTGTPLVNSRTQLLNRPYS
jgi:hypothetical protein